MPYDDHSVPCYRDFINRWRRRFLAKGLAGLQAGHYSLPPSVLTPAMEARILEKMRPAPPDGSTLWSTRKLARLLRINHNHVAHARQRARLQPHRFKRYMQSDDPDAEPKAADVIGLYVNPPQNAGSADQNMRRYIRYNKAAKPIRWTRNPAHRISSASGLYRPIGGIHADKRSDPRR